MDSVRNCRGFAVYNYSNTPSKTVYIRLIDDATGKVWDGVDGALSVTPTYANTAIKAGDLDGVYSAPIPSSLAGVFMVLVYEQAGASPANTDTKLFGETILL